jgi:hypothetical protein
MVTNPKKRLERRLRRDENSIDFWLVNNYAGCLDAFRTFDVFIYIHFVSRDINRVTPGD